MPHPTWWSILVPSLQTSSSTSPRQGELQEAYRGCRIGGAAIFCDMNGVVNILWSTAKCAPILKVNFQRGQRLLSCDFKSNMIFQQHMKFSKINKQTKQLWKFTFFLNVCTMQRLAWTFHWNHCCGQLLRSSVPCTGTSVPGSHFYPLLGVAYLPALFAT